MRISPLHAWMLCLALAIPSLVTSTAEAGKNDKGGGKQPPESATPMTLQWESYYFRSRVEGDCLGEDDDLEWLAEGTLQPGESFTFTPQYPGCYTHAAAITVVASWEQGSLELSSTVPDADYSSLDAEQVGQTITAPVIGYRAELCMFPAFNTSGVDYTITVTNNSSSPVHGIELHGRHENDWALFFYSRCFNADADGDGWNDSLEHSMANLLYPIGYIDQVFQPDILWGSNYLRAMPQSTNADDEIDSFPPDLNDDGAVTATDVDFLEEHLGEGNGIALSQISPNPGANWFWENTLAFRRFDLDGDGWVADSDVRIVEAYLGLNLPVAGDIVAPTARVTSHANGESIPRGGSIRITAHAWDNAALTRVDYLVNDRVICSRTDPIPSFGFESPLFSCWWNVPKPARSYRIEIRAYDAQGNLGLSDPVLVQSK